MFARVGFVMEWRSLPLLKGAIMGSKVLVTLPMVADCSRSSRYVEDGNGQ